MVQSTICVLLTKNHYTCPNGKVFFNASIIWGVIGPQRQFSHGQIYYGLLFFFIIGAVTPVINWLILKNGQTLQSSICIGQCSFLGQGTFLQPLHITIPPTVLWACSLDGGLKKWFHWWSKYNYSLSAGLDIGLAWCSLIIFLCLSLTNTDFPSWWETM